METAWKLQCFPNGKQTPGEVRDGIKKGETIRQDRNEVGREGVLVIVKNGNKDVLLSCCNSLSLTCYHVPGHRWGSVRLPLPGQPGGL